MWKSSIPRGFHGFWAESIFLSSIGVIRADTCERMYRALYKSIALWLLTSPGICLYWAPYIRSTTRIPLIEVRNIKTGGFRSKQFVWLLLMCVQLRTICMTLFVFIMCVRLILCLKSSSVFFALICILLIGCNRAEIALSEHSLKVSGKTPQTCSFPKCIGLTNIKLWTSLQFLKISSDFMKLS